MHDGETILHKAAFSGSLATVRVCLEAGMILATTQTYMCAASYNMALLWCHLSLMMVGRDRPVSFHAVAAAQGIRVRENRYRPQPRFPSPITLTASPSGRRPVLPDPPARSSARSKHIPSCPDRIGRLGSMTALHIAAWYDDIVCFAAQRFY